MSADQARMIRDSRGMPEFIYNPRAGETITEGFDIKGNPTPKRDWWATKYKSTGDKYNYTVAHWAITEARFRQHLKAIPEAQAGEFIHIDNMLTLVTQQDVTYRRVFDETHRAYVPDWGVYFKAEVGGEFKYFTVSRQMVLFAIERRKSWRILQSRAGVENQDYLAQKKLIEKFENGDLTRDDLLERGWDLLNEEVAAL